MESDEKKRREELYAETRKDLLTRQLSNSEKFDGAILTLSTAVLGISLTFIKDIVPLSQVQDMCLIKISWWFFGFAILSTIFSFIVSQLGINTQLSYAEEYYLNNKNEYLTKTNIAAKITEIFNYSAAFFFVMALIFTIIFVSINLQGNPIMTDDDKSTKNTSIKNTTIKSTKASLKEAASIPNLQRVLEIDPLTKAATIPNMQPITSGGQTQSETKPNTEKSETTKPENVEDKK